MKRNGKKIYNRNFTLIVLGQIISLLGNSLLTFILPFYLLKITGSAAIFGTVMALSVIPMIIGSPFGGVLADRVDKRNIMVILDFTTFLLITGLIVILKEGTAIRTITIMMLCLGLIKAFYQPAVNASIPLAVREADLLQANSMVNMVTSTTNMGGPILGGAIYGFLSVQVILSICAVSFLLSAVMEIFIQIPAPAAMSRRNTTIMRGIKEDIAEGVAFISKEEPMIFRILFSAAFINLSLTCFILVGVPYLVDVVFGMGSGYYGLSQSAVGIGTLSGGILTGIFAPRISFSKIYVFLFAAGAALFPTAAVLLLGLGPLLSYGILVLSAVASLALGTIFSIVVLTRIQQLTPNHLTGKVMSLVLMISLCAQPVGQAIYGILFDAMDHLFLIPFGAALLTCAVAVLSRKSFTDKEGNCNVYQN